jgi:hypothetical protein
VPYNSKEYETLIKGGFSGAYFGKNIFSILAFKQKLDLSLGTLFWRFWVPQRMARCLPTSKKRPSHFLRMRDRGRSYITNGSFKYRLHLRRYGM